MHFCHHIVPLFVLCGTYFPLVLGGMVNNFTECIKEGNYMLLDMPVRCLDSKTGKLFFGDVKQIYMQSKMFETVLKSAGKIWCKIHQTSMKPHAPNHLLVC